MSLGFIYGLLLFGVIYVATIGFTWNAIEQDVAKRASAALSAKDFSWVTVDTTNRGRSVLLRGVAPSDQARQDAIQTVADVWGVQSVESNMQFAMRDPSKDYAPHLQIDKQGDNIQLSGALPDDADRDLLLGFIHHRLEGDVDTRQFQQASNVTQPGWLGNFKRFLYAVDDDQDIRITVRDKRLVLDAAMSSDDIHSLMQDARDHFGAGWSIENRFTLADATELNIPAGSALNADLCQAHMNTLVHKQTVNFVLGSTGIQTDSIGLVENIAKIAKACKQSRIRIEGHTDNTGDAQKNLELSQQRAHSVLDLLVKSGVDKQRLQAEGYGMQRPLASNATEQGRAKNRRIEFRVL